MLCSLTFLPNECDFEPLIALALEHRDQMDAEEYGCWSSLFEVLRPQSGHAVKLWDNPTGIYKVFYLLLDGVTCCLTHAKDPVQKSIGEVVMATLILLIDIQGSYWLFVRRYLKNYFAGFFVCCFIFHFISFFLMFAYLLLPLLLIF